jgi:hypothetical protein
MFPARIIGNGQIDARWSCDPAISLRGWSPIARSASFGGFMDGNCQVCSHDSSWLLEAAIHLMRGICACKSPRLSRPISR